MRVSSRRPVAGRRSRARRGQRQRAPRAAIDCPTSPSPLAANRLARSEVPDRPVRFARMSLAPESQERPPRVGAAVLAKALVGRVRRSSSATGAGVAGAGYFQFADVPTRRRRPGAPTPERRSRARSRDPEPPKPGGPRTLLVLGSDRRAKTLDRRQARAVGAALGHDRAGPAGPEAQPDRGALAPARPRGDDPRLRRQHEDQPGLRRGRRGARRWRRSSTCSRPRRARSSRSTASSTSTSTASSARSTTSTASTSTSTATTTTPRAPGFAAIDVQPGYQRLVGSDALAYVRYRHTDSDLFRNARQQDFLRQAANQPAVREAQEPRRGRATSWQMLQLLPLRQELPDAAGTSPGMLKTAVSLADNHAPVNQIALHGHHRVRGPDGRHAPVHLATRTSQSAYDEFMTGEARRATRSASKQGQEGARSGQGRRSVTGLENARRLGEDMAVLADAASSKLPFYFPESARPARATPNDTPRIYTLRDEQGKPTAPTGS